MNVHWRRWSFRTRWLILLAAIVVFCPDAPAFVLIGDPATPTLLVGDQAYVLLPPELVAGPAVSDAFFGSLRSLSPDGRYLLVVRYVSRMTPPVLDAVAHGSPVPPSAESELVLWDGQTHTSEIILHLSSADEKIEELQWMPGSHTALAKVRQTFDELRRTSILRITAATGGVETVATAISQFKKCLSFDMSPTQPFAVITSRLAADATADPDDFVPGKTPEQYTISGLWETGPPSKACVLPRQTSVSVRFAEDGSPILGTNTSSTGAEKMQREFRLDLATGRIQQWSGKSMPPADSDAKEEEEVLPVKLETTQAAAKDANGVVTLRMLWLTARNARPAQRALVAIEAEDGRILPGCTGILYRAKGALWIAPVVRVDIETFQRARTEYLRIILRSDARWINAALRDWARKHGDSFPPPQDLAKDLSPYIELAEAISKVRNYCDVMQE